MKKRKKLRYSLLTVIIITGATSIFYILNIENIENQEKITTQKNTKKIYEHTFPEQVSKKDLLKGEFIVNDIASVYPRREALVRDILFDIGDKVKTGDTLAILFEPGVSGEANSKINFKNTLVTSKNNLLSDTQKVKYAKIFEIDTKINEKEVIINETTKNFDSKIKQIENLTKNKNTSEQYSLEKSKVQIVVEEKNLDILNENLTNAISSQDEKLLDSKQNIKQKEELLDTKINEILYNIIPILYIGNEKEIDYEDINIYDLSDIFGAKNNIIRNKLITEIIEFQENKDKLNSTEKYNKLIIINNLLIETLKNTIISINSTESSITNYITSVTSYNTTLYTNKENYDDAFNSYSILKKGQNEKIDNLKNQIEKQKEIIKLKESTYEVVNSGKTEKIENLSYELDKLKTEKSLKVEKLKAELKILQSSKELLIANENKNITSIKNDISVAKADLNKEYISSGDYKITSPFSGVISKRNLKIGEKISPNTEAFRITGVENTLSRITKKEIKFFIPQNLKDSIELDKEIYFSLGDNDSKSFTGIIYRISPEVDEMTFSITVQAKVNENILLPNKSTIRVNLETKQNIFKIPSSSIYNKAERKIVYYKKNNGKLGVKDINIISDDGEYSLITGSFDETLKVVTTPIFIK